jgi:hypothetical protein
MCFEQPDYGLPKLEGCGFESCKNHYRFQVPLSETLTLLDSLHLGGYKWVPVLTERLIRMDQHPHPVGVILLVT